MRRGPPGSGLAGDKIDSTSLAERSESQDRKPFAIVPPSTVTEGDLSGAYQWRESLALLATLPLSSYPFHLDETVIRDKEGKVVTTCHPAGRARVAEGGRRRSKCPILAPGIGQC